MFSIHPKDILSSYWQESHVHFSGTLSPLHPKDCTYLALAVNDPIPFSTLEHPHDNIMQYSLKAEMTQIHSISREEYSSSVNRWQGFLKKNNAAIHRPDFSLLFTMSNTTIFPSFLSKNLDLLHPSFIFWWKGSFLCHIHCPL